MIKNNLPTIKRKNYTQQARDIIETAIMRGDFKLGEKLVEESIAQQLNISRVPVREALRALEKYGLVVIKPNSGVRVISLDVKDIEEIYDIRILNETYALELCYRNSLEKTLRELERQIVEFKEIFDENDDIYDLINKDFEFDNIVFSNCGNSKLREIWLVLSPVIKIGFFHNPYYYDASSILDFYSHEEIIMNLHNGKIEDAKKILIDHIELSKQLICESFKKGEKKGK